MATSLETLSGQIEFRSSGLGQSDTSLPTFAGIASATPKDDGSLMGTHVLATGTKPPYDYHVYIADSTAGAVSAATLFQDANVAIHVPPGNTSWRVFLMPDQTTYLVKGRKYTLGIKANDAFDFIDGNIVMIEVTAIASGNFPAILQSYLDSFSTDLTDFAAKLVTMGNNNTTAASNNTTAATNNTNAASNNATMTAALVSFSSLLSSLSSSISTLGGLNTALGASATSIASSATAIAGTVTALQNAAASIAGSAGDITSATADLNAGILDLQAGLTQFASDLAQLSSDLTQLEGDVADIAQVSTDLQAVLADFTAAFGDIGTVSDEIVAASLSIKSSLEIIAGGAVARLGNDNFNAQSEG